ncbi:hypothetical protein BJ165DRAFT_350219 [Panaeolus papilionaceus]|nr:hypothetical protein BJ165DRAFT_350219 [Panaeolus papilionaceus]
MCCLRTQAIGLAWASCLKNTATWLWIPSSKLIFGHGCQVCGKKRQHIHAIWKPRKRLCINCIADTFVSLKFVQRLKSPPAVCKMIPLIYTRSKNHHPHVHATAWANEYHALETVDRKNLGRKLNKKFEKFNWTVRVQIGEKASNEIERTHKIVKLSSLWGGAISLRR